MNAPFISGQAMPPLYASVDVVMSNTAGLILQRIKRGELQDRFTQRDITQKGWSGLSDPKRVEMALATLREFGWVRSNKVSTSGRPKEVFEINPAAMTQHV
ncbi:MAG: hypothetical protein ACKOXK_05865 [Chakrabartia sp.]